MNPIVVQILASFLLSVPTFMVGAANAWPSYTLRTLESDKSPLGYHITKSDGSLIGSLLMLGSLSAIPIVGYISDKIGRKRTELLCGLCFALAWSIIATARSVPQILIGRYIIGLGTGMHFVTGAVYIGEISQTSIRGSLLSIMAFMYNIGGLISYIEGWFCSYDVINYLNLTIAVIFVLLMTCCKETPVYLLRRGQEKEALKSLKFYRGTSKVTQEILDELVYIRSQLLLSSDSITEKADVKSSQIEHEKVKLNQEKEYPSQNIITEKKSIWSTLCTSKSTQRVLLLLVLNTILSTFMGMIAIQAYAGQFFTQAAPSLSPDLCSVILATIVSMMCGVTALITDLLPRRVLMITSCGLSAACMACLATMLRWTWAPEWGIPLVMVLYSIFYHFGCLNLPIIQVGESLAPQLVNLGLMILVSSMFLANFAILYVFKPAVDTLGLEGVFLLFAVIGLLNVILSYFFMRETRKVPFEIVQKMFEDGYLYRRQTNNKI